MTKSKEINISEPQKGLSDSKNDGSEFRNGYDSKEITLLEDKKNEYIADKTDENISRVQTNNEVGQQLNQMIEKTN